MLRAVLAAFAALAMSACSYGSVVDMAPFKSRISKPALAPGDYCEVDGEAAPFTIISKEDCVPITWSQASRTYTMIDPEDPEELIPAGVISLGSGLYAAQVDAREDERDRPDRYQLFLFLARGNAFAMLSPLDDDSLRGLAARHKRITFREDATKRPYIAAGDVNSIKTFLRDAAKASLRTLKEEDDELSVGMLDKAGAADHPASAQQTRDIEAVLKLAKSMTPK